jgi:hypothetical protein
MYGIKILTLRIPEKQHADLVKLKKSMKCTSWESFVMALYSHAISQASKPNKKK